jgi:rod shape-determining protein MreC
MLKRLHYISLSLVVLVTLIILNLPNQTTARLKLRIGSLFLPLFGWTSTAHHLAGQAGSVLVPRSELLKENENLRRENQLLRLKLAQDEDLRRENDRLRQLFGWQQQAQRKVKLARVVLREPANWWRTVQIDLGQRDGVQVNLPVLAADGALVGRIASVSLTRSQVVLLGDPSCKAAARVENQAHDTGVIERASSLETGFVDMGYLSRNAAVDPGQSVVTSGLGGIFPKDIPIGKVVDTVATEYYTIARVKLAADLDSLEEVWVVFP